MKSNLVLLGDINCTFAHFNCPILIFGGNSTFESVESPKFSLTDTQVLLKIKIENFSRSKTANLQALNFDFRENTTLESVKNSNIFPKF